MFEAMIRMKASEIFEAILAKELEKGATDEQARDRAQEAVDEYIDAMNRIISAMRRITL